MLLQNTTTEWKWKWSSDVLIGTFKKIGILKLQSLQFSCMSVYNNSPALNMFEKASDLETMYRHILLPIFKRKICKYPGWKILYISKVCTFLHNYLSRWQYYSTMGTTFIFCYNQNAHKSCTESMSMIKCKTI